MSELLLKLTLCTAIDGDVETPSSINGNHEIENASGESVVEAVEAVEVEQNATNFNGMSIGKAKS